MSPMHANFLINTGGAKPPIWRTSANWCEKGLESTGVTLEWEIMRVGRP